jgi:hypothetical protein
MAAACLNMILLDCLKLGCSLYSCNVIGERIAHCLLITCRLRTPSARVMSSLENLALRRHFFGPPARFFPSASNFPLVHS